MGRQTWLSPVLGPVERCVYRMAGVDPTREMDWKKYLTAVLLFNAAGFLVLFLSLLCQKWLPLNPAGTENMRWDIALNTAISFVTNTNWRFYSGEGPEGVSYFVQMTGLGVQNFVSAGTGIAVMSALIRGLERRCASTLGNFWTDLTRSTLYFLVPVSTVIALLLVSQGVVQSFDGPIAVPGMDGVEQMIPSGPAASQIAIKQLGANGGGFFGNNSTHPFENPTPFSNMVEMLSLLLAGCACPYAYGVMIGKKRQGWIIFGAMMILLVAAIVLSQWAEHVGNPLFPGMEMLEGKEVRLGAGATALWSIVTTVTSNGSVNGMHDSTMPISGLMEMLNMQINTWFGGVGVGWMNYFTFIIIAVFISGLMVGRTPEFLCHKVEAREMKVASIVALLHPFVILVGTALAAYLYVHAPAFVENEGGWLNNPGFHGLSEMLYEFTSVAANNGSGFEGLGDNTWFWNYACGIVLILSRFIPIVGQVAIAGLLASKKYIPESAGTLKTDTVTFSVMTFAVIFIVAALSFFPVHALSTIAEHFSL